MSIRPANILGLSRAVPTRGRIATRALASGEPARPAGQQAAPRRLLTRVERSRTSDMGFVTAQYEQLRLGDDAATAIVAH
jgi:hypothetical protein